ncbi:MAG: colicin transporter [Sphingobium sp.]|jgi:hypothetical protein
MIAKRFQSFQRLAACTCAVMGLYMITSQVASERTDLEKVDRQILSARKDIRQLQTELGTRASLRQLERWNGEVLALTTPDADQFVGNERALATLDRSGIVPGPRYAPSAVLMAMTTTPAASIPAPDTAKPAAPVVSDAVERPAAATERRVLAEEARKPQPVLVAVAKPVAKPEPKRKEAKKPIDLLEAKLLDDGLIGELASRARAESGGRR